jgi:prepilin-type N-terminal cleavage/methylation domain-containing protein
MENTKTLPGRAANRQAGVTLIEIMIVLAILALIMGFLVGPRVLNSFREARIRTANMMAQDYVSAYTQWVMNNDDTCPNSLEELRRYRNRKDDRDPWGSTFEMRCGDNAPEGVEFGVLSPGPDKKTGTDDDIRSW